MNALISHRVVHMPAPVVLSHVLKMRASVPGMLRFMRGVCTYTQSRVDTSLK